MNADPFLRINRLLHDIVVKTSKLPGPELPAHIGYMTTPFRDPLAEAGYFDGDDEDEDDDVDFYAHEGDDSNSSCSA